MSVVEAQAPGASANAEAKLELVSSLLSTRNSSNVDAVCYEGLPLLTLCAAWNVPDAAYHLLSRMKANVNIKDRLGYTPLHYAVAHENTKIVFILLHFAVCGRTRKLSTMNGGAVIDNAKVGTYFSFIRSSLFLIFCKTYFAPTTRLNAM
jgi:ankyrin repeat protein